MWAKWYLIQPILSCHISLYKISLYKSLWLYHYSYIYLHTHAKYISLVIQKNYIPVTHTPLSPRTLTQEFFCSSSLLCSISNDLKSKAWQKSQITKLKFPCFDPFAGTSLRSRKRKPKIWKKIEKKTTICVVKNNNLSQSHNLN